MSKVFFSIYGYNIKIESPSVLELLPSLKYFFVSAEPKTLHLHIQIEQKDPNISKKGVYLFKTRMCEVRQIDLSRRQLVYRSTNQIVAVAEDDTSTPVRHFQITAKDVVLINEILLFYILSTSGEFLETHGFVRLHACAVTFATEGLCIWGRSKSGKSTLAYSLKADTKFKVLSDELCLIEVKSGIMYPFPISIALNTNNQISETQSLLKKSFFFEDKALHHLSQEETARPTRLSRFFILKPANETNSRIAKAAEKAKLAIQLIWGQDLIQMSEFLIRLNNPIGIWKILANRIVFTARLMKNPIRVLQRSSNFAESLKFIKEQIISSNSDKV